MLTYGEPVEGASVVTAPSPLRVNTRYRMLVSGEPGLTQYGNSVVYFSIDASGKALEGR